MSGAGDRFNKAGYTKPKPLIRVDGRPMVEHIVRLFSPDDEFIFVCNSEYLADKALGLEKYLTSLCSKVTVINGGQPQRGPNYAILAAKELLDDQPVLVSYCDYNLDWNRDDFIDQLTQLKPDSASVCYIGFHPHLLNPNLYAGVRVDPDNGFALEVREKYSFTEDKMKTWQQAGLFYFASGEVLKRYCERALTEGWLLNEESYTSLLFNPMMADGLTSWVYPIRHFCQWGTPEDLEEYEAWSQLFAKELGIDKGVTDIPADRLNNARIKWAKDSDEYCRSYNYWQEYFSKKFSQ
ncbi:NTP transferase domain-containing protein [Patescibacteria group bacterium]|nr:NTP transferase domain-containing protein [Patescibacteria group bacterium]